jgi:hypothetical protein
MWKYFGGGLLAAVVNVTAAQNASEPTIQTEQVAPRSEPQSNVPRRISSFVIIANLRST